MSKHTFFQDLPTYPQTDPNIYRVKVYQGDDADCRFLPPAVFPFNRDDLRFLKNLAIPLSVTRIVTTFIDEAQRADINKHIQSSFYYPNAFLRDQTQIDMDLKRANTKTHLKDTYTNRVIEKPDNYLEMCQQAQIMINRSPADNNVQVCVFTQTGDVHFYHDKPTLASVLIQQKENGFWQPIPRVKSLYQAQTPDMV